MTITYCIYTVIIETLGLFYSDLRKLPSRKIGRSIELLSISHASYIDLYCMYVLRIARLINALASINRVSRGDAFRHARPPSFPGSFAGETGIIGNNQIGRIGPNPFKSDLHFWVQYHGCQLFQQ